MFFYFPSGHGGYIPFFDVPCERYIGETILWIIELALAPLACKLVPWSCCPLELGNSSYTINADLNCNDAGAVYSSTAFWTMQAVSIVGLVLAMGNLGICFAELMGHEVEQPELFPLTFDVPDLTMAVLSGLDVKKVKQEGQVNFVKKKVIDYLQHKYKKELQKKEWKVGKEEKEREDEMENNKKEIETVMKEMQNETVTLLERHGRKRRQVNVDIPILSGFITGGDEAPSDRCLRNEVLVDGEDECFQVLTQGPCEEDEIVLINPKTKRGFCGPRLCPPDKVFIFSDQLCHDPRELGLCPPGRMLFSSSFGAPVCGCPDGTYEEEDDPDENVCEPVLGANECGNGQVFWFSDFKRPPRCVPDPCGGLNERRGEADLPYVPALLDGKCYRIGTRPSFCKPDEFYSISFELLRGVCTTLEDAGFTVLDNEEISLSSSRPSLDHEDFNFGSSRPSSHSRPSSSSSRRKSTSKSPSKRKFITPASTTLLRYPQIGSSVVNVEEQEEVSSVSHRFQPLFIGGPVVAARPSKRPDDRRYEDDNEVETSSHVQLRPTHMNAFSPSLISVNGSVTFLSFLDGMLPHHRLRRSPLPFASPGNVFEPGLSACRAGAERDGNAKCRETVLPSRYPPAQSRSRRSVPPVPPKPACPNGTFRGLDRQCTKRTTGIASSINALGLG